MKYPCNLIKDLLPLYIDNVCSKESKEIVKNHLPECTDCKAYYNALTEGSEFASCQTEKERELVKAQTFINVKKKLRIRQAFVAIISAVVLIVFLISTVIILSNWKKTVIFDNNISVTMTDGSLIGRLNGTNYEELSIKRVVEQENGREYNYLFFCIYDNKWNELITGKDVYSEFVICPEDKGADKIDAVYYFTGDTNNLDNLDSKELQQIIENSKLLWSK